MSAACLDVSFVGVEEALGLGPSVGFETWWVFTGSIHKGQTESKGM